MGAEASKSPRNLRGGPRRLARIAPPRAAHPLASSRYPNVYIYKSEIDAVCGEVILRSSESQILGVSRRESARAYHARVAECANMTFNIRSSRGLQSSLALALPTGADISRSECVRTRESSTAGARPRCIILHYLVMR